MYVLLLSILIGGVLIWFLSTKSRDPVYPGEPEFPLLGHLPLIQRNQSRLFDLLLELTIKHGNYWTVKLPFSPRWLFVQDAPSIEYVLKTNFENYEKGDNMHEVFFPFLGDGIFNADGQLWKQQRQVAAHLFSVKELKQMVEVFYSNGQKLMRKFESYLSTPDQNNRPQVDIQEVFQRFTLDSIGKIAFGVDLGCMDKDTPFSKAFDEANEETFHRMINPLWKFLPHQRFASTRKMNNSIKVIDEYSYKIIAERKNDPNVSNNTDLLSRYMSMADLDDKPFSDLYLRNIVINFILAGRDTTSQLLTWSLFMLSGHPEVEKKVRKEIKEVLGDEEPNYDNTKNMKYLKAVLDETLRLWPPVPNERKVAVNDDVFPNGKLVKKGTVITWSTYVLGRQKEYWGDDALEFKPERWLTESPKSQAFIPFLAGPRTCLGQQMAYVQVKVILSMLLRKFHFEHVPGHVANYDPLFITLRAIHGMNMFIESSN